jgi:hypothetical protein
LGISLQAKASFGRGFAALLACLMLSQILMIGFAQASSTSATETSFGVTCLSSANSTDEVEKSQPPLSHSHHHGSCCILHNVAINLQTSSLRPFARFHFPEKSDVIIGPLTSISHDLELAEEPNAPRAPPYLRA